MKKALLVDDVRPLLELENSILKDRGVQIFTASSVKEALGIHRREKVDLIVCNLHINGSEEFCRIVRTDDALRHVSIIMVMGSTSDEDIARCKNAGANDAISEPVDPTEFLKKINKYIEVAMRRDVRIFVKLVVNGLAGVSEVFIGMTVNVSSSGFLLETGRTFSLGEAASFLLLIPDKDKPIYLKGEVVRKGGGPMPNMNYYGVKFVDIKEEDKKAIDDYSISINKISV